MACLRALVSSLSAHSRSPCCQTLFAWISDGDCTDDAVLELVCVLSDLLLSAGVHRVWMALISALKATRR